MLLQLSKTSEDPISAYVCGLTEISKLIEGSQELIQKITNGITDVF